MNPARRSELGQSLVEFALIIPIFLLVVVGVFDLGRYVVAYNALANAAREGARLAVVNQDQSSIQTRVQQLAFLTAPTLQPTLYLTNAPATNDADLDDNPKCGPAQPQPLAAGCVAVVRLAASLTPVTPIVSSIVGPITLQATSMQPVEFICPNSAIPGFTTVADCPKQP